MSVIIETFFFSPLDLLIHRSGRFGATIGLSTHDGKVSSSTVVNGALIPLAMLNFR